MSVSSYIPILALAIFAFITVGEGTDVPPTPPTHNKNLTCTNETWIQIRDNWREVKACHRQIISFYLGNRTVNENQCTKASDLIKEPRVKKFENVFAKCYNNSNNQLNESLTVLYDLTNFTTGDNKFKAFIDDKGVTCINKTHVKIRDCIRTVTGRTKLNHTMLRFVDLMSLNMKNGDSGGCDEEPLMKTCVQKVLENETSFCKKSSVEFFTALSDFVTKKYCNVTSKPNSGAAGLSAVSCLFTALTTLALM